jgi:hypothetical protein
MLKLSQRLPEQGLRLGFFCSHAIATGASGKARRKWRAVSTSFCVRQALFQGFPTFALAGRWGRLLREGQLCLRLQKGLA